MPEFEAIGWIKNLTPPVSPLSIAGISVERLPHRNTLDNTTLRGFAKTARLHPIQEAELLQAVEIRQRMAIECQMRARVDAVDERAAGNALSIAFQDLIMAIQLVTNRAVDLVGWAVGKPDAGGIFFVVGNEKKYRGGPATIAPGAAPVLEELLKVLEGTFPQRIDTALLEFETALKSEDVRRQFIHSVVALEALFGDDKSRENLRFKVSLRSVQLIPSLAAKRKEGFKIVQNAYDLRSTFVHGSWNEKTLKDAEEQIDQVFQITGEALQEFLFRARDGKVVDFPALDEELFF
jgi:hypothetical protein